MRILHIGYRLPPERGGKERYVERLTHEQLLRGHRVLISHRQGRIPDGAETLSLTPTRASQAISRKSDVTAFAMECARALTHAGRIDVINVHGDHREALALGPAARRLGIPVVVTVHGALTSRHRLIMPWAFRHVNGFIAIGTRPTDDLLRVGIPAQRIRTMSSGLDLTHLAGFRNQGSVEPGLIVSVGSLEKVKNHALTIRAFRELRIVRPDARLVIVGEGAERAHLQQLAGPGSGIQFTGQISSDHVYSLVSRAQIFVLASARFPTIGEGIPTAALEALALGTPVVVSSDASLDPIIEDRGACRVFRSGSSEELVAHLRSVLEDERSRLHMIERGQEAVSSLDWPLVAARIEEWYETFMIGRASRLLAEMS
ncbi:glycosyltransferase family 4 protein [Streptosporangium sp. NPDC006007]|uniref:glycosyltransferase family 4 protein n=1 Tax=Streptosporangium sp. NPDC006007 TaxID=3154575 RepID=UPI0033A097A1